MNHGEEGRQQGQMEGRRPGHIEEAFPSMTTMARTVLPSPTPQADPTPPSLQTHIEPLRRHSDVVEPSSIRLSNNVVAASETTSSDQQEETKLRFRRDAVFGREDELQTLCQAHEQLSTQQRRQVVLLGGRAGVGKTTLVRQLQRDIMDHHEEEQHDKKKNPKSFWLTGKFEQQQQQSAVNNKNSSGTITASMLAWNQVLTQLCSQLSSDPILLNAVRESVFQDNGKGENNDILLREDVERLAHLCPVLATTLLPFHDAASTYPLVVDSGHHHHMAVEDPNDTARAFTESFCKFVRRMTQIRSWVVFLDDFHWSDASSFVLLQSLVKDRETAERNGSSGGGSLMLILAYRNEEEAWTSANENIQLWMRDLMNQQQPMEEETYSSLQVTHLELKNLHENQVRHLIVDCLSLTDDDNPDETAERLDALAHVVYRKTQGNPLFVRKLLQLLVDQEWLHFQTTSVLTGKVGWTWNVAEIDAQVQVSTNVCDILLNQMRRGLSAPERSVIFIASVLGFTFPRDLLEVAIGSLEEEEDATTSDQENHTEHDDDSEPSSSSIEAALWALQKRGFLETLLVQPETFRFTHDKIQEAAKQLYQGQEFEEKCHAIGSVLVQKLSPDQLDTHIFCVVSLLSTTTNNNQRSSETKSQSSAELARLHYQAGQKSLHNYAFEQSVFHLQQACHLYSEDIWTTDYGRAVDLHSSLMECQLVQSDPEAMSATFDTLRHHTHHNRQDRFRGSITLMRHALVTHAYELGRDTGLELLRETYQCEFPKRNRTVRAITGLSSVMRRLSKMSTDDLLALPNANPQIEQTQLALYTLMRTLILLQSNLKPFCPIRSVQLTLDHGLSDYACTGLCNLAVICVIAFQDFRKARRFCEQAHALLEARKHLRSSKIAVATHIMSYGLVWHWSRPLKESMVAMVQVYRLGRRCGANEDALLAIFQYAHMAYSVGRPLQALAADLRLYIRQMKDCNYHHMLYLCQFVLQAILNLTGESKQTSHLLKGPQDNKDHPQQGGGVVVIDDTFDLATAHPFDKCHFLLQESILCVYFCDYERGHSLAESNRDILTTIPGAIECKQHAFYASVLCFAMALQSGQGRRRRRNEYIRQGRGYAKLLRRWASKGDPNVTHRVRFLGAEWAAVRGRTLEAIQLYRESIKIVSRLGFGNDHALFRERFGMYLLKSCRNDNNKANAAADMEEMAYGYLANAYALYKEWGAEQKAACLLEEHGPRLRNHLEGGAAAATNLNSSLLLNLI